MYSLMLLIHVDQQRSHKIVEHQQANILHVDQLKSHKIVEHQQVNTLPADQQRRPMMMLLNIQQEDQLKRHNQAFILQQNLT